MTDKKQILKELEHDFNKLKEEVGFNATLEDLDKVFWIKDAILSTEFISEDLSRQICSKISETFHNWINYLNNLILPNPSFMPSQTESKLFSSKEDKELIWDLMQGSMKFVSKNSLDVVVRDKNLQKELIDGALDYWNNEFSVKVKKIMQRIHDSWNKN